MCMLFSCDAYVSLGLCTTNQAKQYRLYAAFFAFIRGFCTDYDLRNPTTCPALREVAPHKSITFIFSPELHFICDIVAADGRKTQRNEYDNSRSMQLLPNV
jgi:hypothetical protein